MKVHVGVEVYCYMYLWLRKVQKNFLQKSWKNDMNFMD